MDRETRKFAQDRVAAPPAPPLSVPAASSRARKGLTGPAPSICTVLFAVVAALASIVCTPLAAARDAVRIDSPQDGATVRDAAGNVFVELEMAETDLAPEMRFRLFLDGEMIAVDAYVPVFRLTDVEPGEHVLEAHIVDRQGKTLERAKPVRFRMASPEPLRIDRPEHGALIEDESGRVFVELEMAEASLAPTMRFRVLLDGRPAGDSLVPIFRLQDVPPGPHRLVAQILDRDGKVIMTSKPIEFRMSTGDDRAGD